MGATIDQKFAAKTDTTNTAQKAFEAVVNEARYQFGNSAYNGSIAQKRCFDMLSNKPMTWNEANEASKAIEKPNSPYYYKDSPAACIIIHDEDQKMFGWMFVGWVGC